MATQLAVQISCVALLMPPFVEGMTMFPRSPHTRNYIANQAADVGEYPQFPARWVPESTIAGEPYRCSDLQSLAPFPNCTVKEVTNFIEASDILQTRRHIFAADVNKALFLGDSSNLTSCRMKSAPPGNTSSMQLVVDARYSNRPRCCDAKFDKRLVLDGTEVDAGTRAALRKLPWEMVSENFSYYKVTPRCGPHRKCGLVVTIPGAASMPWFLLQGAVCSACAEALRSVLVCPLLPLDIRSDDRAFGSSASVLDSLLFPLVKKVLAESAHMDRDRVYIIGESRGIDTALRAALMRPDLFSMGIFSGSFVVTKETLLLADSLRNQTEDAQKSQKRWRKRRLQALEFHIGDQDRVVRMDSFLLKITAVVKRIARREIVPHVGFHVYIDSPHAVWYAAWNTLHDVLWTGRRKVKGHLLAAPSTCRP